jgi:predicted nucleotide-binding protein (sugar kinase/HSP70/actin superfamily)
LGHYGEVQEVILRSLGYEFELINLSEADDLLAMIRDCKRINPSASYPYLLHRFWLACEKERAIDIAQDFIRKNAGFECRAGAFDASEKRMLREIDRASSVREVRRATRAVMRELRAIEIDKPKNPMRVGLVGEFYLLCDPFSNFYIERQLEERGIEVHRFVTATHQMRDWFFAQSHLRKMVRYSNPYLEYIVGAHGTESVGMTNYLRKLGFEGVIHVKPFGCMPEVNATAALHCLSREHTFPVLCLSYDEQASETGVRTRIEAFCDMLELRRRRRQRAADDVPVAV